jgi:ribosome recycling factor
MSGFGSTVPSILDHLKSLNADSIESFRHELTKLRTGRASVNLLDHIHVDYYGTPTPLNQVAQLAAPEARLLTIKPWERKIIAEIEKAIRASDLGLNPVNDGELIRLPLPTLTEERRKEMVKHVKTQAETFKVSGRTHRRDALEALKKIEKTVPEDDIKKAQDQVQKVTDEFAKKIDEIFTIKEKELLTV